jgi:hypothetical protein
MRRLMMTPLEIALLTIVILLLLAHLGTARHYDGLARELWSLDFLLRLLEELPPGHRDMVLRNRPRSGKEPAQWQQFGWTVKVGTSEEKTPPRGGSSTAPPTQGGCGTMPAPHGGSGTTPTPSTPKET